MHKLNEYDVTSFKQCINNCHYRADVLLAKSKGQGVPSQLYSLRLSRQHVC